jgi:predicted outer membrane repeat protein
MPNTIRIKILLVLLTLSSQASAFITVGSGGFMNIFKLVILLILSQGVFAAPLVVPVGPASDVDCQFNTVQEAVDSGGINMDIRISNQAIIDTGVVIVDKDVSYLRGGYANCQDAIDDVVDVNLPWTAINNPFGNGIEIGYLNKVFHTILLQRLLINQNNIGLKIFNDNLSQRLTVNLENTDITGNRASGIDVKSTISGIVVNFDNGVIANNNRTNGPHQALHGGGINCIRSEINLGESVAINNNFAAAGAGINLYFCNAYITAGDTNPINALEYGIFSNTSTFKGAGVYVESDSNLIAIGTEFHPVSITNNSLVPSTGVITRGGGIAIGENSTAQLINLRMDNNTSLVKGGGIYASKDGRVGDSPLVMIGSLPEGCIYDQECNSISHNSTTFTASAFANGAALYLDEGAIVTVAQTLFEGNHAVNTSIFKVSGGSQLGLLSDLIINNTNDVDLIDQDNLSNVIIHYSTLADNQVSNYFNVQYDNNNAQVLEVKGSIIKNGQATIANLNNDMGNHDAQVACSLVENNDASGVVQNGTIIGDPGFIDSTNYKLSQESIALNASCFPVGKFDIVRYDILGVDRFGSGQNDMGAYEMGYLFKDGFE